MPPRTAPSSSPRCAGSRSTASTSSTRRSTGPIWCARSSPAIRKARCVTPRRLSAVREGGAVAARPRLHVLAIGVNEYWDSRLRLTFANADAKAVGEALRKSGEALYDGVEVTTLVDDAVTRDNLDKVFAT